MKFLILLALLTINLTAYSQGGPPYHPETAAPVVPEGYELVWHDLFDGDGRPGESSGPCGQGFVRNSGRQWHQGDNGRVKGGGVVIGGRREKGENDRYDPDSKDWGRNREWG